MRSPFPAARAALAALAALVVVPALAAAQAAPTYPERAIRHDIPMTDMIRRALAAGTRDSSGRPGRNYWQLWNDYTINARFDPATGLVTGHEHVVVNNNGPNEMREIVLRLDQNLFTANVPKAETVTDITDGMQVTALSVDGKPAALNAGGPPRGRGRAETRRLRPGARRLQPVADRSHDSPRRHPSRRTAASRSMPTGTSRYPRWPPASAASGWGRGATRSIRWASGTRASPMFDDLRQGGWDTDPYLGPSEFYNNFGHFDVKLDLPAGWLVGATGILQNPDEVLTTAERDGLRRALTADSTVRINGPENFGPGKATAGASGDRLVWHFVADTAGDVAWATSNQFVWDGYHAAIPEQARTCRSTSCTCRAMSGSTPTPVRRSATRCSSTPGSGFRMPSPP